MKALLMLTALALLSAGGQASAPTATAAPTPGAPTHLSHGRFKDLTVYSPAGPATSFVLLLSGDAGWNAAADALAAQLAQQGAMVTGIDYRAFKAALEADGADCVFPDGDLENLSHFVQAYFHNTTYLAPLLVGLASGGSMAYAVLAQAPKDTFAAALSIGFCAHIAMDKPLCKGSGLELTHGARGSGLDLRPIKSLNNPWVTLQGSKGAS